MLSFLLDEHISPRVAKHLQKRQPQMIVHDVLAWKNGLYLSAPDELLLEAAYLEELSLVTFDLSSIPAILKDWAEQGIDHGGVILVDDRTLPPNDVGGLIHALEHLWCIQHDLDWTNRVLFLRPPE